MFGRFRKKVTQQTVDTVRQFYGVFQNYYGTPPRFWHNDFVIGFFGTMIGVVSQHVSQGKLPRAEKGHLLADAFSSLSNMNGIMIGDRYASVVLQDHPNDDFSVGADNGFIISFAYLGIMSPKFYDGIRRMKTEDEAQELIDIFDDMQLLPVPEQQFHLNENWEIYQKHGLAAYKLMQILFVKPVAKYFDLQ